MFKQVIVCPTFGNKAAIWCPAEQDNFKIQTKLDWTRWIVVCWSNWP